MYKYVGRPVPRIEGKSLCMGRTPYMEDQIPRDCLVIKLVHCPYPFAEVESFDSVAAEQVPGLVRIFTWKDTDIQCTTGFTYSPYEHTLMKRIARYQGDVIAMVVAETEAAALEARDLLNIRWKVREPVMDPEQALDNPIVIHGDQLDRIVRHQKPGQVDPERDYMPERNQIKAFIRDYGDYDKILAGCDRVVRVRCRTSQQMHCQFETHRSFAYVDERGILVITGPMQVVFPVQDTVALMLGIDKRKIQAVKTPVGGGFGGKNIFTAYMFPAFAAWVLKRPVMLIMTREESMTYTGTRHAYVLEITLGADRDGTIRAAGSAGFSNGGAYAELSDEVLNTGIHNVYPIFPRVDALRIHQRVVHTNKVIGCAFRGFGATQNIFAMNCAARRLAARLGLGLPELFLKNIPVIGDSHPVMNGWLPDDPAVIRSIALRECILRAMELIGWKEKRNVSVPRGNPVRGLGLGIAVHASGVPREDRGCVTLTLNADGSFSVFSGHSDIGTGSNTAILQIVAEALDVPMEIIRLRTADSAFTPFDNGTYASSNVYRIGGAARLAAEEMKARLIRHAGELLGLGEDALSFHDEGFYDPEGRLRMTLSGFADKRVSYHEGGAPVVTSASFPVDFAPSPYIATCVELEVDRETGFYRLLNMSSVVDSGRIINPVNARVQALGGIVQSIGMTMFEAVRYGADGNILTKDFESYKIPCQMDVPPVMLEFIEASPEPSGPFGAKSLGEIATGSPAPAICDALFNALGVHVDDLPVTPERLLRAIHAREAGRDHED
ncbi:MAG: xanthine dehydrogenase family protein molybdopterin-binding subunit [Treponema sp.]|nr:xanthine dehydrogenase family protein molybdopterin-binding subunit [Treponema sp.]